MSQPAIIIENLSKQYRLGDVGTGTLSHDLKRWWYAVRGKEDPFAKIGETNDRTQKGNSEYVWALKDINLQINQGDAVGIIGRNGAGKSTLLKLLSKTTAPTTGSIKVKGRIASLLEVGTGFHPELSGRDNIYLNGAILGMRKREIDRKLDEIVDFAGVERYLDTPVKRYSSGMYVRLAFGVAAHLESEILIVDEVLAVGDAEFQKKCLGKMGEVSQGQGRTVLFVSHNMASIQNLCNVVMMLKNGFMTNFGTTEEIITEYLNSYNTQIANVELIKRKDRQGNGSVKFLEYWFENSTGERLLNLASGLSCFLCLSLKNYTSNTFSNVTIGVGIDAGTNRIIHLSNESTCQTIAFIPNEEKSIKIGFEKLPLQSGNYTMTFFAGVNDQILDWVQYAGQFFVEDGDFFNTGKIVPKGQGNILVDHNFIAI